MVWAVLVLLFVFVCGGVSFAVLGTPFRGRKPRLTAWHRTAIVLTVGWLLVVSVWRHDVYIDAQTRMAATEYRICLDQHPEAFDSCLEQASESGQSLFWINWANGAGEAALSLIAAWLLAYIALWSTKWIMRGQPRRMM